MQFRSDRISTSLLCLALASGCATETTDGGNAGGQTGDSAVANQAGVTMMDPMDGGSARSSGGHGASAPANSEADDAAMAEFTEPEATGHDAPAIDEAAMLAAQEAAYAEPAAAEDTAAMEAAMAAQYEAGLAGTEGGEGYGEGFGEGGGQAKPPEYPPGSAEYAVVKIVMAVANGNEDDLKQLAEFISDDAEGDILPALRSGEVTDEQLAKFKEIMGRVRPANMRNSRGKVTLTMQNDKGQFLHFRCSKNGETFQVEELDVNTPRRR